MRKYRTLRCLTAVCMALFVPVMNSDAQPPLNKSSISGATSCYQQQGVSFMASDGSRQSFAAAGDAVVTHWSRAADDSDDLTTITPPAKFNPGTAASGWLTLLGIPARPTAASAAAEWDKKWNRPWTFEQPSNMCSTNMRAGFSSYVDNSSWAGVVDDYYTNYYQANSDVIIPSMDTSCGQNSTLALWTGIGGTGPFQSLIQSGLAADGDATGGMYAWWEINQNDNNYTNIIPVSGRSFPPNDDVHLSTAYDPRDGSVTFSWFDYTTGGAVTPVHFANLLWANHSAGRVSDAYDGSTAEFIDERVTVNNGTSPLLHHADHQWQNAQIKVGATTTNANVPPYQEWDMTSNGSTTGTPLSYIRDHMVHNPSTFYMHQHACS